VWPCDKETNLAYNYFRDFDPALGRYVQSDPIGLRGGLNTYAYVGSDPLSFYDPDGLDRWGGDSVFNFSFKAGVPIPQNPELYIFTTCLRNCIGEQFVVTSTHEKIPQHPPGSPHANGVAIDIKYLANPDAYLCCAKRCGARFGLDEKRNPSPNSTAKHFHLQLTDARRKPWV
jgi:RHS repeat-associated protein